MVSVMRIYSPPKIERDSLLGTAENGRLSPKEPGRFYTLNNELVNRDCLLYQPEHEHNRR